MHRLLLIVLMFMLPLQWSWAAAASICAHEVNSKAAHFGHHEHAHDNAQPLHQEAESQDEDTAPAYHADCGVCHGAGTAFLTADSDIPATWTALAVFASYKADVPDRSVETLLRPPLTLVS